MEDPTVGLASGEVCHVHVYTCVSTYMAPGLHIGLLP